MHVYAAPGTSLMVQWLRIHLLTQGMWVLSLVRLIGKDSDAGKDWRQEEKGMIEDEMVGWHHWLNGHEFEQTLGGGEG